MSALLVIPARYESQRFPGKPLEPLTDRDGTTRPLIHWTWLAAKAVTSASRIVVASDDDRIIECAYGFGAETIKTSSDCRNGTERTAEAAAALQSSDEIIVNLQGDAPLTPGWFVDDLIAEMSANADIQIATPVLRCDGAMLGGLLADRKAGRVGATTAVFGANGDALYFSKEVLPYAGEAGAVFHHVGLYAYRPGALRAYRKWSPGRAELAEGLEQLRFLENRCPVRCVEVDGRDRVFWELNNPSDAPLIEPHLHRIGAP